MERTGTFIAIHSQVERLKTEGVVDFFQAIKSARLQRTGFVHNTVSYKYTVCYSHQYHTGGSVVNFSYYKELRNDDAHLWLILTNLSHSPNYIQSTECLQ